MTAFAAFPPPSALTEAHCSRDLVVIDFSDANKKEVPQEDDSQEKSFQEEGLKKEAANQETGSQEKVDPRRKFGATEYFCTCRPH